MKVALRDRPPTDVNYVGEHWVLCEAVDAGDQRRDIRIVEAGTLGSVSSRLYSVALRYKRGQRCHMRPLCNDSCCAVPNGLHPSFCFGGASLSTVVKQCRRRIGRQPSSFRRIKPLDFVQVL